MQHVIKFFSTIILIVFLQGIIYVTSVKPYISSWGATSAEQSMPLKGDAPGFIIDSTRAVLIRAPQPLVWQWLMQLGADRGGFFSYEIIENVLGYHSRYPAMTQPRFGHFKVGDWVQGSLNEKESVIPFRFQVTLLRPDQTMVLSHWGTFFLQSVGADTTRLIVRTQHEASDRVSSRLASQVMIPLHYIMERRMLLGIKDRAENGKDYRLSNAKDMTWFLALLVSAAVIVYLIGAGRGVVQRVVVPFIFSTCWQLTLLWLEPVPLYSVLLILMLIVFVISRWHVLRQGTE